MLVLEFSSDGWGLWVLNLLDSLTRQVSTASTNRPGSTKIKEQIETSARRLQNKAVVGVVGLDEEAVGWTGVLKVVKAVWAETLSMSSGAAVWSLEDVREMAGTVLRRSVSFILFYLVESGD
jgi:hypothetical protein